MLALPLDLCARRAQWGRIDAVCTPIESVGAAATTDIHQSEEGTHMRKLGRFSRETKSSSFGNPDGGLITIDGNCFTARGLGGDPSTYKPVDLNDFLHAGAC